MSKRNKLYSIAFLIISLLALASSLGTAFKTMPLNPDMAEMALIYKGMVHYGWSFPFTWRFTQDNQVLSLLPFAEIYYVFAGVSGSSIIVQGWLIFVINAGLSGLLVKMATHSWRWAVIAWLLALLANPMAVGQPAILAYPVTHNSVWAFGLLGIYWLIKYLTVNQGQAVTTFNWDLALLLACVFIGTVSDPWFDAAFTAPALILAWRSSKWFQADESTRMSLIKGLIITYIAGRATYFCLELIHMVPASNISFASPAAMKQHLLLLVKSMALFLQLYPVPNSILMWGVWIIYAVAIGWVSVLGARTAARMSLSERVLLRLCGLSIAVISIAFVVTGFAQGIFSARFLINSFYLYIVMFAVLSTSLWKSGIRWARQSLILVMAGYTILGLGAINQTGWRYNPELGDIPALAHWLQLHNLRYGFGQYFGANAPLLPIVSDSEVIARPLSCNMGYLIPRLSSGDDQFWFGTQIPSNHGSQFVLFESDNSSWPTCATKDFGAPNKKYRFNSWSILVYNHNLMPQVLQSYKAFGNAWEKMNISRNRKGIEKVSQALGINPAGLQNAYTWLLVHHLAR